MPNQILIFVLLPNGISAEKTLKLSIYLTPRLDDGATLAAFPDILNWPASIKKHGLKFQISCGAQTATVPANTSILRPDVWSEIFKPNTYVEAYSPGDFDQRLIVSYPARDALSFLKYAYQSVGGGNLNQGGDGERGILQILQPLSFRDGRESTLDSALRATRLELWKAQQASQSSDGGITVLTASIGTTEPLPADGVPTVLSSPSTTSDAIHRFALFHHMPPAPNRPPLPSTPADFAHTLDFHRALTALNSYPSLLRALGLVFDVEVPSTLCPNSPNTGSYPTLAITAVTPGFTWSIAPRFSFPETAYFRDADSFAAAPVTSPDSLAGENYTPGDVIGGMLALAQDSFNLLQVDLDGALLNALSYADNVANLSQNFGTSDTAQSLIENVLPALRSSGIGLIASGRGEQLLSSILNNKSFNDALTSNSPLPRPSNAVDLVRGYRIDIWDSLTRQWHSLHRRNALFEFGEHGQLQITAKDEEGFLQTAVAQPADDPTRPPDPPLDSVPPSGTDIYIHERVARWDGWSLSVARPGLALNRNPDPAKALDPDPTANQPITPFKMVSSFTVAPGSLPELRFGRQYQLRARTVDLAGNSVPLNTATPADFALPANGTAMRYMRFEPVGPPLVVLLDNPKTGGSLERLVIRSYNSSPALDSVVSPYTDQRHIAPPRTSVRMAERHSMLDDAQGKLRGDQATYNLIVSTDEYQFPLDKTGKFPLVSSPTLDVGYLPDPIARGAALRNLPNTPDDTNGALTNNQLGYHILPDVQPRPGSVTFIDFGDQWPGRLAFRMVLVEGSAAPAWDTANRVLTVYLQKGSLVQVPLSCYLSPHDLESMGVWGWIRELFDAQQIASFQSFFANSEVNYNADLAALISRLVLEGGHEMITPARTLTLVHAVQQPLGLPTFIQLPVVHQPSNPIYASALRNSFTPITAWRSVGSHNAVLLGGLTVNGHSTSKIDLEAQQLEIDDNPSLPAPTKTWAGAHVETIDLSDLSGGLIYTDLTETRAVAVYIPQVDQLWFAAPFDDLDGVETPSIVAAPLHRFDDTKHRWVSYQAMSTSRFQEYFSEPNLNFTRIGPSLIVDVPSSARPVAPDVAYVIPTFGWENQETTNVKTTVRFGNGMRVYLNRPWYSSGDNELLGVVLWADLSSSPDYATREKYKPYFTQWGVDPIWQAGLLSEVPSIYEFLNTQQTASGLALEETSDLVFDVAAYPVNFDQQRNLWFCDIEINVGLTYFPFIRLALARYQPHSIQGVELSRVVLADYIQLSPARSAIVSIDPNDSRNARVFIGGAAPQGPTQNTITVTVQRHTPNVLSDLAWEDAPSSAVQVTEDAPAAAQPEAVLWSGSIAFNNAPPPGQFRIVIREFETLPADAPILSLQTEAVIREFYASRLVFAAIIAYDYP